LRATAQSDSFTFVITGVVIFFHVLFSVLVMVLVLMHSGRDSGLGSLGGGAGTGGGQHVMERNLDRVTVIAAILFLVTTLALHNLYE
jgi:preprotein translocase subunit SecG